MQRIFYSLLVLLITFPGIAQENEQILSKSQNSEWLENLGSQELNEKLQSIKQRLTTDAEVYFIISGDPHGIKNVKQEKIKKSFKHETRCRPLYIFKNEGKESFLIPNNPSSEMIAKICEILNPGNISKVEVEKSTKMMALYGQRASCGVVFITVGENAILENLKAAS